MKSEKFFYCSILDKIIKITSSKENDTPKLVSFGEKEGFCRANCKLCTENCVGCNLL